MPVKHSSQSSSKSAAQKLVKKAAKTAGGGQLPGTFKKFSARFPALTTAHEKMGQAARDAGPLSERELALVKIGLCVGAGKESALRSHIRRAMADGMTMAEVEHAIVQAMTTLGFPQTVQAWSWAQIQFERDRIEKEGA